MHQKLPSKGNTPPVYVSNTHPLAALNENLDVSRNSNIRRRELFFAQILAINPISGDTVSLSGFESFYSRSDELGGHLDASLGVAVGTRVECNQVFDKASTLI